MKQCGKFSSILSGLIPAMLFVISNISIATAQGKKSKAFCKLSGPEKLWVFCHPFIAGKAWSITEDVRNTTNTISKDSILDGDIDGGQVDAFRHVFWMASLSREFCWKKAFRLGEAHEKGNYKSYLKNQVEDKGLPDSAASSMDRFNNGLGLSIGRANQDISQDSLKTLVILSILSGEARILHKNKQGQFLDCDGDVLQIEQYADRWIIPKCLVPSNKGHK